MYSQKFCFPWPDCHSNHAMAQFLEVMHLYHKTLSKVIFLCRFGKFYFYFSEENPEKIQKENEELKELYTCKICLDERVGITFVPCGHLVTCKTCSPKIRRCPLCRTFIRGTIKTTM